MANDIKLGDGAVDNIMLGGDQVDKVMLGDTEVWTHALPVADFEAEFTMEDTADTFVISFSFIDGDVQYSSDNVNWTDVTAEVSIDGSLKWYVRQKPGGQVCTKIAFIAGEFIEINNISTSNIIDFHNMFVSCPKLKYINDFDAGSGTNFEQMFRANTKLEYVGNVNSTSGINFINMFNGCSSLTCIKSINTINSTVSNGMFTGCTSLTAPNTSDQALIDQTPGISWTNPNPCP